MFPPPKTFADINSFPLPAWDLLENIDKYVTHIDESLRYSPRRHIKMNITRSCVFRCGFCFQSNPNVQRFLGPYRVLRPEKVVEQIHLLRRLTSPPPDSFDFIDMLTLYKKDHIRELGRALGSIRPEIDWYGSSRYRVLTHEVIEILKQSRCHGVFFGVESGSPRMCKLINKDIDFAQAAEVSRNMARAGIHSIASYILGFPTETLEEAEQTIEVMKSIPSTLNHCNVFILLPGTPLYQFSLQQKLFTPPRSLQEWVEYLSSPKDVNVSSIEDEVLFSLAEKIAKKEYAKFFLRYQKEFLAKGRLGHFCTSLWKNKLVSAALESLRRR